MKKRRDVEIECVEEAIGVHEIDWEKNTTVFATTKTVKVWRVK